MQDLAWIGRIGLHTSDACLSARRKVLQVLLDVEGHMVRCTPMAACTSEMCRWLLQHGQRPELDLAFHREEQNIFATLVFFSRRPLPASPEVLRHFGHSWDRLAEPGLYGVRLRFALQHLPLPTQIASLQARFTEKSREELYLASQQAESDMRLLLTQLNVAQRAAEAAVATLALSNGIWSNRLPQPETLIGSASHR